MVTIEDGLLLERVAQGYTAKAPQVTESQRKVIRELLRVWHRRGWSRRTEAIRVALSSLQHLGKPYRMCEDSSATHIDCSTLVSQSIWEGAMISCPLTAERMRTASTGIAIEDMHELLPGDVAIRYKDKGEAPDRSHNHVALVLGQDESDVWWLCESAEGKGVDLITLDDFQPDGGFRRFTPTPLHEPSFERLSALNEMVVRVPKLGRFGVKQYRKGVSERVVHTGVDIYVPEGTEVLTNIQGELTLTTLPSLEGQAISIKEPAGNLEFVLGHLTPANLQRCTKVGTEVQLLGTVKRPSSYSQIEYSERWKQSSHLHLEIRQFSDDSPFPCPVQPLRLLKLHEALSIELRSPDNTGLNE